jgi:hypothetical protein
VVVGFELIPQQIPRVVIAFPPSNVIFPPVDADDASMLVIEEVVIVGKVIGSSFLHPFTKSEKTNTIIAENTIRFFFTGLVLNLLNKPYFPTHVINTAASNRSIQYIYLIQEEV